MYFRNLREDIKAAIMKLPTDQEFQDRFGHDPVLDSLDEEQANPQNSLLELMLISGKRIKIGNNYYKGVTPFVWSFLWCIKSPLVTINEDTELKKTDIDLFLYLVEYGVDDDDLVKLVSESFEYSDRLGITLEEASEVVKVLISLSFSPLKLFPYSRNTVGQTQAIFDGDWITAMVAKVHSVTGYSPEMIMTNMNLTACCYYYAQYARMQGVEHIQRRLPEEIVIAQENRAIELVVERLIELGVVNEEEKESIMEIMRTPPDNNK